MQGSREHPGGVSNLLGEWRGAEQEGVREAFSVVHTAPQRSASQPGGETRDSVNTGREVGKQPDGKDRRLSRRGFNWMCAGGVARNRAD